MVIVKRRIFAAVLYCTKTLTWNVGSSWSYEIYAFFTKICAKKDIHISAQSDLDFMTWKLLCRLLLTWVTVWTSYGVPFSS